jgi:hypothetical protein
MQIRVLRAAIDPYYFPHQMIQGCAQIVDRIADDQTQSFGKRDVKSHT